jgi:hypothetical protein
MSHEIMKVSATEAIALGKQFHESGMFPDIKSAAQAIVKIQAGSEIGIPPFAAMSGIHIIQGKPTIGAGIMAAAVKGSGKYDYRVLQQDEKACIIDFYQGKDKIGTSTFTIEDAKKAGTKNLDKFARNMLFARAMSNGVKWFTPDVFSGPVYVPEEMATVTEDATPVSVETAWKPTDEQWAEANELLNNSTLDQEKRDAASVKLSEATNQAGWTRIVNRLREVQTPVSA